MHVVIFGCTNTSIRMYKTPINVILCNVYISCSYKKNVFAFHNTVFADFIFEILRANNTYSFVKANNLINPNAVIPINKKNCLRRFSFGMAS